MGIQIQQWCIYVQKLKQYLLNMLLLHMCQKQVCLSNCTQLLFKGHIWQILPTHGWYMILLVSTMSQLCKLHLADRPNQPNPSETSRHCPHTLWLVWTTRDFEHFPILSKHLDSVPVQNRLDTTWSQWTCKHYQHIFRNTHIWTLSPRHLSDFWNTVWTFPKHWHHRYMDTFWPCPDIHILQSLSSCMATQICLHTQIAFTHCPDPFQINVWTHNTFQTLSGHLCHCPDTRALLTQIPETA